MRVVKLDAIKFQSTHLLRGATVSRRNFGWVNPYFNPRTSCEVRPYPDATSDGSILISIHAPLARCDCWPDPSSQTPCNFNPRTSCEVRRSPHNGRCTLQHFNPRTSCEVRQGFCCVFGHDRAISIHAPLARCDSLTSKGFLTLITYFNPRTSCEVRLLMFSSAIS